MDWGTLASTLLGAAVAIVTGWLTTRHQERVTELQHERDDRRLRREQLQRLYSSMLPSATDSRNFIRDKAPDGPVDYTPSLFRLLAPPDVLRKYDRCRNLYWDWVPANEYDEGTDEMLAAYEELLAAMRTHLEQEGAQLELPSVKPRPLLGPRPTAEK